LCFPENTQIRRGPGVKNTGVEDDTSKRAMRPEKMPVQRTYMT
jgi:hypothetical protein